MADPIKRLHYFNHQFLRAADFSDEQAYHLAMRRRHNRLLHTWGVVEPGLALTFVSGATRVTISEGTAIDGQGREIVQTENQQTADLSGFAGKAVYVTMAYGEQETDETTETGVKGSTRWSETPVLEVTEAPPTDPSEKLILGRVTIGDDGKISALDEGQEPNRRHSAGVVGGDLEVRSLTLTDPGVDRSGWPRLRLAAANVAILNSSLRITSNAEVQGALTVTGNGTVSGALTVTGNGTVGGALTVQRNLTVTRDSTMNGSLTVAQAVTLQNALSVGGDVKISGGLTVGREVNATGAGFFGGHVGVGTATPENSENWDKVLDLVAANHAKFSVRTAAVEARIMAHSSGFWGSSAGMILGTRTAHPVSIGTGGAVRFIVAANGEVTVNGRLNVLGGKNGYVTDRFINNLGEALEEGDVVVIGKNQAALYYGLHNGIPVLEVDLAQKAYDSRVCGIVAEVHAMLEAVGEASEAQTKGKRARKAKMQISAENYQVRDLAPEEFAALERTKVAPGQVGAMVTLGAFAHCKVDADVAPIQVGDLLTTSPTRGHAQKVIDPTQAVGAILGKALGALEQGKGKIPVLVMLQ